MVRRPVRAARDAGLDGLLRDWARAVLPEAFPALASPGVRGGAGAAGAKTAQGWTGRGWDPLTQPLGPAFWAAMDAVWSDAGLGFARPASRPAGPSDRAAV
jgi:hypothetical protein